MILRCNYDESSKIRVYLDNEILEIGGNSKKINLNNISKGRHVIKIVESKEYRKKYSYIFRWLFSLMLFLLDALFLNIEREWMIFASPVKLECKIFFSLNSDEAEMILNIKKSKYNSFEETFFPPQIGMKFFDLEIEKIIQENYLDIESLKWELNKYLSKIFAGIVYFSIFVALCTRSAILEKNITFLMFLWGIEIILLLIYGGVCITQVKKYHSIKKNIKNIISNSVLNKPSCGI